MELYSGEHTHLLSALNLALHAKAIMRRDVDYVVQDGDVRLVDSGRGRIAASQRWPDGLHAAVEAKEGVPISPRGVILDTLTVQDLALRYRHLSGMSATITAVADDLLEFYGLHSGRIGRHAPLARIDHPEVVLDDRSHLLDAAVDAIVAIHRTGQPVLVGTLSVAESEQVAARLSARGVVTRVLNAKNDAAEAAIIAEAGAVGAITISTQISGRGTDIVLGGPDGRDRDRVTAVGGLAVVGIGRFPSRRLDEQLRGRSGRQGDRGTTSGFSSLEDELVLRQRATCSRTRSGERDAHRPAAVAGASWSARSASRSSRASNGTARRGRTPARSPGSMRASCGGATTSSAPRSRWRSSADEAWADHLALLQELRDGIHLRSLAGEDPLDSSHTLALAEFDGWEARLRASVRAAVERLTVEDVVRGAIPSGIRRPSVTWTYMLSDTPFGDALSRATRRRRR